MTGEVRPFQVFDAALADTSLIEASAGTGKTWTIAALYARLVLERDLPVASILVVTYTKAATAELRERIRARLAALRTAFVHGRAAEGDAFAAECLARYDSGTALERLVRALTGFDEAAIYTIHGFCQRALSDHAFESAMPFHTEVLADEAGLLQEVVEDFWRRELYTAPRLFVRYVRAAKLSPQSLRAELTPHLGKSYLVIEAPPDPGAMDVHAQALGAAYAAARACWHAEREEIRRALEAHPNKRSYQPQHLPGRMAELDAYFAHEEPPLKEPAKGEHFTAGKIASAANGKTYKAHAFFALWERLAGATREFTARAEPALALLKQRLIAYARTELARRKLRRRVQSYDDLLNNLARALAAPGSALAEVLRARYAAALVDEFQDTDPIQYQIFSAIYGAGGAPVFFVGDPKQAIYSFRGADVFAYLKAKAAARRQETLRHNWRSTPALIGAVNAVFGASAHPFLIDRIAFPPAQPAERERAALAIEGDDPAALRVWLAAGLDEKALNKGDANPAVAGAVATEIVRLLRAGEAGRARIGERALGGGDIAVLVRTHRQAAWVKRELRRRGVASVEYSQESVFQTDEAVELERVLMAIAEPRREGLVRAALATEMLGYRGEHLETLRQDEFGWQRQLDVFHDMHALWSEHGFIRMFRELLAVHTVAARLLGYADGERRLTNLNHLAELLQRQSVAQRGGMEGLILWLAERRRTSDRADEAVLRLESDEHLVKIVTVHAAKGLEYPVVFCPFLWDGGLRTGARGAVTFHDPAHGDRAVLDLGTGQRAARAALARREEFAENLRLAYVALTRAQHRCYAVWGRINHAATSPLAWLLHGDGIDAAGPDAIDALKARFDGLTDAGLEAALRRCAGRAPKGAIAIDAMPEANDARFVPDRDEAAAPVARRFRGSTAVAWRVGSFSGLAARAAAEAPDYDEVRDPEPLPAAADDFSIYTFPRGTRAGSCLHAVFQHLDFTDIGPGALEPLVERTLRDYRFPVAWLPAVAGMTRAVVSTALDGRALRLDAVTRARRVDEMEFHYPVRRLDVEGLKRVLAAHGFGGPAMRAAFDSLSFAPVRGFLKGYIDLVFEAGGRYYLVDYKSNWLGAGIESYGPEALAREIAAESYYLQYLLYTVALHRYLATRLPDYDYERHCGGAYYLFLRGMDPARGNECGVFHDRPSAALVAALDAYLRGTGPEEGDARAA